VLQRLDPRVKVAGLFAMVVSVALAAKLWLIAAILALAVVLAVVSAIPIRVLASRTWLGAFLFSGAIALPALFLTPGTPLYGLPITRAGRSHRQFPGDARGDGRDPDAGAGVHHAVDAHPESAADFPRAGGVCGDPRNDVPLHSADAGDGARNVRIAQEPDGESHDAGGKPPPGDRQFGSAAPQDAPHEQRSLSGHAGARISRRSLRAGRFRDAGDATGLPWRPSRHVATVSILVGR
jgi:energy-coupling factor transporter transmembrane protein EcfT